MPARTRFRICQTIKGRPRTFKSGLGQVSVSGRMRSPRPAAKIIAFIVLVPWMRSPAACRASGSFRQREKSSKSEADLRRLGFERVEQSDQRRQCLVAAGRLARVIQRQRQILQITVLAVTMIQPRENAEHLQMALQP